MSKSVNAAPLGKLGRTSQTHALLVGIQDIGTSTEENLAISSRFVCGFTVWPWRNWSQRHSNKRYHAHAWQHALIEKAGLSLEDAQLQCNRTCISSAVGLSFVMASWLSACALVESHLSFSGVCLPRRGPRNTLSKCSGGAECHHWCKSADQIPRLNQKRSRPMGALRGQRTRNVLGSWSLHSGMLAAFICLHYLEQSLEGSRGHEMETSLPTLNLYFPLKIPYSKR